ncbi:GNAT family N-acetyltransferase [Oceanobacillus sp. CAU 1775]
MYTDEDLTIRPIKEKDLPRLWELIYKDEAPEWKKWDAPYFPHQSMTFENFQAKAKNWIDTDDIWAVTVNEEVCGTVSYYYEDAQKNWLEMGIVLHEAKSWSKGLGTRALQLWMKHIFSNLPVVRVGLTTWSGNKRMIRVAEKLHMQMEGRIRKVRFYEGEYYDSIRMGILREEWQEFSQI